MLAGPDRSKAIGARDYALLLLLLRTCLRAAEACSLKASSIRWSHGRWILKFKVKGGRERTIPLPVEVRKAIEEYLNRDAGRRSKLLCGGPEAYIFQPEVNYRTLIFDKALSTATVWNHMCSETMGALERRREVVSARSEAYRYHQCPESGIELPSGSDDERP